MAAEIAVNEMEAYTLSHPIALHTFGSADTSKGSILFIPDFQAQGDWGSEQVVSEIEQLCRPLKDEFHFSALLSAPEFERPSSAFLDALILGLEQAKLKRLTLVGFRSGALLAMNLAAASRELVRRMALIEPNIKPVKAEHGRLILALEKLVPFGLPLKTIHRQPSLSNYSHRVRCPALIMRAAAQDNSNSMLERIPNARSMTFTGSACLPSGELNPELCSAMRAFVDVPAKRSQKNA